MHWPFEHVFSYFLRGSSSQCGISAVNNRPISITAVLSKVLERLVSVRLGRFMEWRGVLPTTQFSIEKVSALMMNLFVCHTLNTEQCIEESTEGQDCADRLQFNFWQSQPSGNSLQALLSGHFRLCAVCFNTVTDHNTVMISRSWWHDSWFCSASFGVLFCSAVFRCLYRL